jgi:integrase
VSGRRGHGNVGTRTQTLRTVPPHVGRTPRRGTATITINRELAVLSHLFNKTVEWGWMDRRPAKINRFSGGHGRLTYLTVDQVSRLIECAKADGNPQIYPFIVIGLETAMRKSEILSIRREHIDLQRRVIFIPKAKAGVDLPTVKRISGHKTLAMVERYSHQNGAHIQAAMDRLQARLKLAS